MAQFKCKIENINFSRMFLIIIGIIAKKRVNFLVNANGFTSNPFYNLLRIIYRINIDNQDI